MNYDMSERMRIQEELTKNEQFVCPANKNHILKSLDRQRCHVNTCMEIKNMGAETRVYFCQHYEGHMFMDKRNRDDHEVKCPWLAVPGNPPHDPKVNRFILVKGNTQSKSPVVVQKKKKSHHKGYYERTPYEEPSDRAEFQFIREPNRINLELDQKFKQIVEEFSNANVVTVSDARGDLEDLVEAEFPVSNQQMKLHTLTQWMATCIQHGIPYCEEFKINHTIRLELRNKLQAKLRSFTLPDNFRMQEFIPCEVVKKLIKNHFRMDSYKIYLDHMKQEYKVKVPTDKFEKEFIECIQQTTTMHSKYKTKSVICDLSQEGLFSVLVPKQFMSLTQMYATSQTDLVHFVLKLKNQQIVDFLQPHVKSKTLFVWTGNKQEMVTADTSKMETEDTTQSEKIEYEKVLDGIEKYKQIMRTKESQIQHKFEVIQQLNIQELEYKSQYESLRILGDRDILRLKEVEAKPKQKFKEVHEQIKITQDEIYRQNQKHFEQFKTQVLNQASDLLNQAEGCMIEVQTLTSRCERANDKHKKLWDRIKKSENEQLQIKNRTIEETHQNIWHVGEELLCQICGKYRTNILYIPCHHAPICQVCYSVLKKKDISNCIFCQQPCKTIKHLNWENGFMLGEADIRVMEKEEKMIIE